MNTLATLAPRQVGRRVVEPAVEFDMVERSAHAVDRCPVTCDAACVPSSHSYVVAEI